MSLLEEPKAKKVKIENPPESVSEEIDKIDEGDTSDQAGESVSAQRNDQGDAFYDLSKKKRVTIREFKGKTLVDIREFYEKDGKCLPGKKGISLTLEQYNTFRELVVAGDIDREIQAMEH